MDKTFNLSIGNACNLRCGFCYNDLSRDVKQYFHPFEILIKIIFKIRKDGIKRITLIGGEPTMHPMFFQLIKFIEKNNINITLVTNGVKISDESFLKKVIQSKSIDNYIISFHSLNEEMESKISGRKGIYDKKIRAIKNLLKHNLFFGVNFVINNNNILDFDKIIKNLQYIGINKIRIYNMIINFKTSDKNIKYLPEFRLLLQGLDRLSKKELSQLEFHWFPACIFKNFSFDVILREFNGNYSENIFLDGKNILSRLKEDKITLSECSKCEAYERYCFGSFENYVKKFGQNEFYALNKQELIKIKSYNDFIYNFE